MLSHFAVVGNPISHSLSPRIHQYFAEQFGKLISYQKIAAEPDQFESTVLDFFSKGGKGLNVTSPFKQRAFSLAEVKHPNCFPGNAANTLWRVDGRIHAENTDGIGFINDLSSFCSPKNKNVLLIGAGGAARSIISSLLQTNVKKLTVINRSLQKLEQLQLDFAQVELSTFSSIEGDFDLIINATSLHLKEERRKCCFTNSIPQSIVKSSTYCYDLGYALLGKMTPFIAWATANRYKSRDGLGMLIEQAAESFYIWHGVRPETGGLWKLLRS